MTDEAGDPIEGIVVSAAAMLTTGDAPLRNPLTNEPIVGQATTDANGDYTITDLLSGIFYAVTANPEPKVGDQANCATDNTTYSVELSGARVPRNRDGISTSPSGPCRAM